MMSENFSGTGTGTHTGTKICFRVGIDLMGGEMPPSEIFDAALQLSNSTEFDHEFHFVGTFSAIEQLSHKSKNIHFVLAEQQIEMDESPLLAVRRKKKSSIAKGMELIKNGTIDAFVSSGNTGALVASASLTLDTLPGILRSALLVCLPTKTGFVAVLDVGANVHCKTEHLLQFAKMGALFQNGNGIDCPKVGLLNIGIEAQKGTKSIRDVYDSLKETESMNFLGNVEGDEVFQGSVDVLVTDGFTGNVFLKTTEGVSAYVLSYLEKNLDAKEEGALKRLHMLINHAEYPGALLCGVNGIVIKCHGHSCAKAITNGIKGAFDLIQKGLIDRLRLGLQAS